jgi:hypothetical protein
LIGALPLVVDYRLDVLDYYESRAFQVDKSNNSSVEVVPRVIVPRVVIQAGMPLTGWPCDEHVKTSPSSPEQCQLARRAFWAFAVQRGSEVSLAGDLVANSQRFTHDLDWCRIVVSREDKSGGSTKRTRCLDNTKR